jgi:hypothetical protein
MASAFEEAASDRNHFAATDASKTNTLATMALVSERA